MYVYISSEDYIYIKLSIALSKALIEEYIFKYSLLYIPFLASIPITILRALKKF